MKDLFAPAPPSAAPRQAQHGTRFSEIKGHEPVRTQQRTQLNDETVGWLFTFSTLAASRAI
jgi:hypothetical protein